jgi:hypothetical protein
VARVAGRRAARRARQRRATNCVRDSHPHRRRVYHAEDVSRESRRRRYLISVNSLNIGRYMLMITMPTMIPTPSIMIGSTIDVSDWIEASTSSS